jgi:hypothetical protein
VSSNELMVFGISNGPRKTGKMALFDQPLPP